MQKESIKQLFYPPHQQYQHYNDYNCQWLCYNVANNQARPMERTVIVVCNLCCVINISDAYEYHAWEHSYFWQYYHPYKVRLQDFGRRGQVMRQSGVEVDGHIETVDEQQSIEDCKCDIYCLPVTHKWDSILTDVQCEMRGLGARPKRSRAPKSKHKKLMYAIFGLLCT